MLIKSLQFKNFKRFSDLTINLDPENKDILPKLVLLIGANGSGKSSIFDGFEVVNDLLKTKGEPSLNNTLDGQENNQYYKKANDSIKIDFEFGDRKYFNLNYEVHLNLGQVSKVNTNLVSPASYFYGRSAFRYTPEITKTTIGTVTNVNDDPDRSRKYIEYDINRFSNDIDTFLVSQLRAFSEENPKVKTEFNKKFNQSFQNIFGLNKSISLNYVDFEIPSEGKPFQFLFKKGDTNFNYNTLSAGEKMVFELLFNLHSRSKNYQNSIIFLDEIDLHLNTSLQYNLLKEITENWIPENCQLWVASHSLGFIDYAREYDKGAIIDLDSLDFDNPQVLTPKQADEFDVYNVIFGVSDNQLKPKFIDFLKQKDIKTFVCEGSNQEVLSEFDFKNEVFTDKYGKNKTNKKAVINISKNDGVFGLIDKDYLMSAEIEKLKNENERLRVLSFYCFENYLYHPSNIAEKYSNIDIEKYKNRILELKNEKVNDFIVKLALSRNEYKQLDDQEILIKQFLESNDFDVFYPFLDINKIDKSSLIQEFKLGSELELAKTDWLKSQILEVLNG